MFPERLRIDGQVSDSGNAAPRFGSSASIRYLDTARATEAAQAYKRQSLTRLGIRPGHKVLDVGCGPGDDVRVIGRMVGGQGRAVGIDCDCQMIAEAWRRLGNPRDENVEFRVGDAHRLPFRDSSFDGCRSDRVFQHLENPRLALQEMLRVARAGASVVVSEPDWETLTFDAGDRSITRRIVQFIADHFVRHGWMGRQLPRLFKEQALASVQVDSAVVTTTNFELADTLWGLSRNVLRCKEAGVITADEMNGWLRDLEQASQASRFFGAHMGFVVSGRKHGP